MATRIRKELEGLLEAAVTDKAAIERIIDPLTKRTFTAGELEIAWLHYTERRPPPWYRGAAALIDEHHHIVIVAAKRGLAALTFSDPTLRSTAVTEIRKGGGRLAAVSLLTSKQMNDAFVGDRVRTLWLGAAHRRTATKADSKILAGTELEAALDPLDDQGYYFSSIRSTVPAGTVAAEDEAVLGANPRNARVWLGPSRDWTIFAKRVDALIDTAAAAIATPLERSSPLPVLAQPLDGIPDASESYGIAITGLEEISAGEEDEEEEAWLHEFSDAARFEIKPEPNSPSFNADVFWGDQSYGRLSYFFESAADGSAQLRTEAVNWDQTQPHQERIHKICADPDRLTVYYDTGHTFSRGLFYATQFRDARFTDWSWAKLDGFDLKAEKPLDGRRFAIENIGNSTDSSLFGFVAKHWPNHTPAGASSGWLICDDGAMESSDFIHFDPNVKPPRLTLIHVKGSGSAASGRNLSVSDYEVVVSQAVKNLRYLDRSNIHEKLTANRRAKIGSAVWLDGARQPDRDGVLAVLKKAGTNFERTVCVFQPSARRRDVEAADQLLAAGKKDPKVRRLQQLNALLLSARAECLGLGAQFVVLGHDDA